MIREQFGGGTVLQESQYEADLLSSAAKTLGGQISIRIFRVSAFPASTEC